MKLLKDYFKLEKEIKNYFGYVEQWKAIPLSDETDMYWFIANNQCVYSDEPISLEKMLEVGPHYSFVLYGKQSIYRKDDYTMLVVDTNTDFNIFLMIFDNEKECKDPKIIEVFKEW